MIEVWTDGLCEPVNPGGTGCAGYIIKKNGMVVDRSSESLGASKDMTNNVAEYSALVRALLAIRKLGFGTEKILFRSDSKLLVSQMKGKWKVRGVRIAPLHSKATELAKGMAIDFQWIPREENEEADRLCREAYESVK